MQLGLKLSLTSWLKGTAAGVVPGPSVGDGLLLESGDFGLLENGDFILLE